jgi:hypothetical protein
MYFVDNRKTAETLSKGVFVPGSRYLKCVMPMFPYVSENETHLRKYMAFRK